MNLVGMFAAPRHPEELTAPWRYTTMMNISKLAGVMATALFLGACASAGPAEPDPVEGPQPTEEKKADEGKVPAVEVGSVSPDAKTVCRWMTCCDAADGCSGKYRCLVCD